MATRRLPHVVDTDGTVGRLREVVVDDNEQATAYVELGSDVTAAVPFASLHPHPDGGYALPARWSHFTLRSDSATVIPVVEERARVEVRPAPDRHLRVRRRVVVEPHVVETPIWRERFVVERVPVNAEVDAIPGPRRDGDTLIVPRVEQVVETRTRLVVREELRIRVVREQVVDRQTVELRRHELDLDPDDAVLAPSTPTSEGDSK